MKRQIEMLKLEVFASKLEIKLGFFLDEATKRQGLVATLSFQKIVEMENFVCDYFGVIEAAFVNPNMDLEARCTSWPEVVQLKVQCAIDFF